jgi:hypothetical protein
MSLSTDWRSAWIWPAAFLDPSASFLTSSATTANPLPCSPALAASIAALRESRLVCCAILVMIRTSWDISWDFLESLSMDVEVSFTLSRSAFILSRES